MQPQTISAQLQGGQPGLPVPHLHLHHKAAATGLQAVAGAEAGEEAVHGRNGRKAGGHKRANLPAGQRGAARSVTVKAWCQGAAGRAYMQALIEWSATVAERNNTWT